MKIRCSYCSDPAEYIIQGYSVCPYDSVLWWELENNLDRLITFRELMKVRNSAIKGETYEEITKSVKKQRIENETPMEKTERASRDAERYANLLE